MRELFVTDEIALKLQELAFDEDCIVGMSSLGIMNHKIASGNNGCFVSWMKKYDTDLPLPLWQQAIDWLRETRGVHVLIYTSCWSGSRMYFTFAVDCIYKREYWYSLSHDLTYNQAREQAVLKAIEIAKSMQQ